MRRSSPSPSAARRSRPSSGRAGGAQPERTGQPSQECGDVGATSEPAGFGTSGFATAEGVYANGSGHNVSQYDVACFQVTSAGPPR